MADVTRGRQTARWPRILKVAGIAFVVAIVGWWLMSRGSVQRDISLAREMARLAPLPADATDIHASSVHSWTWMSAFVRFTASPESVEAFLSASPGLMRVRAEEFDPKHMYLPFQSRPADVLNDRNSYFHDYSRGYNAPWFDRTIRGRGRRYVVPADGEENWGEVVVDDVRHVVYIYADQG